MKPDTQNWIALSDYDLETARHMLTTGRYLYVVIHVPSRSREDAQGARDRGHSVYSGQNA